MVFKLRTRHKFLIAGIICASVFFLNVNKTIAGDVNLSNALYYKLLTEYTCRLQIDYYNEFNTYLKQTKSPGKPVLIPYYIGLAYFELGKYKTAAQSLTEASLGLVDSNIASVSVYKYYSKVMQAACGYKQGKPDKLDELLKKRAAANKSQNYFLGYILLRLNYRIDLAKELLANCPADRFGEVTGKWINYKLSRLAEFKLTKYRLKKPELEENYGQVKLKNGPIMLNVKYYNPAELSLLKEIYLFLAQKYLDSNKMENLASLGQISYLLGNYKKAVKYLEDYQRAFPLDLSASILLGQCYYVTEDIDKANRLWDFVEMSGNKSMRRELALILSGIPEKQQTALALLEKCKDTQIDNNPRFDAAFYRQHKNYYITLGRAQLNLRKFKQAADTLMLTYERSRRDQPRTYDRTYLLSLGYALSRTGRYKEAIDYALKGAASLDTAAYQIFHAVNYGLYMLKAE